MVGGGGLPAGFTVNGGPWAGQYNTRRDNDEGTVSFWGPAPGGKVRGAGPWGQEYDLPQLHFTVDPTTGALHGSLEMGEEKNAHRHWNNGSPNWDLKALDGARVAWKDAVETTHPGQVDAALAQVANQLATGNIPAFVPAPAAAAPPPQAVDLSLDSEQEWPSLGTPAQRQPAPVVEQPAYAEAEFDQTQPAYAEQDQYAAYGEYEEAAPEQQYQWPPPGLQSEPGFSLFSSSPEEFLNPQPNPTVNANLDESDETGCTLAVSDGRSLWIARETIDGVVAGTINVPPANDTVTFDWMGQPLTLPDNFFTET
jgi:hypothetical protein